MMQLDVCGVIFRPDLEVQVGKDENSREQEMEERETVESEWDPEVILKTETSSIRAAVVGLLFLPLCGK